MYGGEHAYLLNDYLNAIHGSGIVLVQALNPYQSNINLYPETVNDVKRRIAGRLHVPAGLILDFSLVALGAMSRVPGRLYTFVGRAHG